MKNLLIAFALAPLTLVGCTAKTEPVAPTVLADDEPADAKSDTAETHITFTDASCSEDGPFNLTVTPGATVRFINASSGKLSIGLGGFFDRTVKPGRSLRAKLGTTDGDDYGVDCGPSADDFAVVNDIEIASPDSGGDGQGPACGSPEHGACD